MSNRFRHFIAKHPFILSMKEDAVPEAPKNPDSSSNDNHFDALKNQLGISDSDFDAALSTGSITVWKTQDFSSKWGFIAAGPIQANIQKRPDGMYNVTFQLRNKKLMMPNSFTMPYKEGEKPTRYDGPVDDKMEIMTAEELQDIMATPWANGGPAGAMPPMGPAAGAPPMGGAPPPMGGMPPMGAM